MKVAPMPENELERLSSLYSYGILDTLPEKDFDAITKLASQICNTSIALITLIDKDQQWFKSKVGITDNSTARDISFCSHALLQPEKIMEIPDVRKDERFADNPFVTGPMKVAFYAGVPLVDHDGYALGTLCVIDSMPRALTPGQQEALRTLATQAMRLIELHRKNAEIEQTNKELQELNHELERYAFVIAHDLQSPCNQLITVAQLINDNYAAQMAVDGQQLVLYLKNSAENLKTFIHDILGHARTIHTNQVAKERFSFTELMEQVCSLSFVPPHCALEYAKDDTILYAPKALLSQILRELVYNAVKYNDKEKAKIKVTFKNDAREYIFGVEDNGKGFPIVMSEKIFELFQQIEVDHPAQENKGYGLGLNTVKKLVEKLGGTVKVTSKEGVGSTFTFTIRK
jgi:signal transduction histidine kinase